MLTFGGGQEGGLLELDGARSSSINTPAAMLKADQIFTIESRKFGQKMVPMGKVVVPALLLKNKQSRLSTPRRLVISRIVPTVPDRSQRRFVGPMYQY